MKKLKIVLVCKYSSEKLRENLLLKQNRFILKTALKIFKLPDRVGEYADIAPWMPVFIDFLSKRDDIELHVICNHIGVIGEIQEFVIDNVNFHVYSSEGSSLLRIFDNLYLWKILQQNSKIVHKIIRSIEPDLAVFVGIENPETGIGTLYIKECPILILSQTMYTNPKRKQYSKIKKINWNLEYDIHKKVKYVTASSMSDFQILMHNNPLLTVLYFEFPTNIFPKVHTIPKEYDFINFALQLDSRKGVQDSILALAKVKEEYPNVTLNLVGRCNDSVKEELESLIKKNNLIDNVFFTPFFEKQADMFQHIHKAKYAVLPCKLDYISGTQRQALYYGFPTVVYRTDGTATLNKNRENVLIAEHCNIDDLASKMKLLLSDSKKSNELKENCASYKYELQEERNSLLNRLVECFIAVIDNNKESKKIPNYLLFNKRENDI